MLVVPGVSAMTHGRMLGFGHCLMIDVTRIGQIAAMSRLTTIVRRWLDALRVVMMRVLFHDVALLAPAQVSSLVYQVALRSSRTSAPFGKRGVLSFRLLRPELPRRLAWVAGSG
jgi:hypothetical protein